MTITYKNFNKIMSHIAPSGNSYELQEVTLECGGKQIPHRDGQEKHYRAVIFSNIGMFLGTEEFGADMKKAQEWIRNRK